MRSSTSNSDAGRNQWLQAWLLAAGLVIMIIATWEGALRYAGFSPEYADNRGLWLSARHQLSRPDPSVIAVLGASRVQRAVDVDNVITIASLFPIMAVLGYGQLATLMSRRRRSRSQKPGQPYVNQEGGDPQ